MTCGAHRKRPAAARRPGCSIRSTRIRPPHRTGSPHEHVPEVGIPTRPSDRRRHLPCANCEASLDSGCIRNARRHTGSRHSRRSMPMGRDDCSVIRTSKEPHPRCPSVSRKPPRLSLDRSAAGRPQRAQQATHRPCSIPGPIRERPAPRPRSESNAWSAHTDQAALCPTVGRSRPPGGGVPRRQNIVGAIQKVSFNISLPINRRQHA